MIDLIKFKQHKILTFSSYHYGISDIYPVFVLSCEHYTGYIGLKLSTMDHYFNNHTTDFYIDAPDGSIHELTEEKDLKYFFKKINGDWVIIEREESSNRSIFLNKLQIKAIMQIISDFKKNKVD